MTGSQRQHLKRNLNRLARISVMLEEIPFGVKRCARCGCRQDEYLDDCETCQDRRRARQLRTDAAYREQQSAWQKARRERRVEAQRQRRLKTRKRPSADRETVLHP